MTTSELSAPLVRATAASFTPGPNTTQSTALAAIGGLPHPLHWASLLGGTGMNRAVA
jgi:hypothetical protein